MTIRQIVESSAFDIDNLIGGARLVHGHQEVGIRRHHCSGIVLVHATKTVARNSPGNLGSSNVLVFWEQQWNRVTKFVMHLRTSAQAKTTQKARMGRAATARSIAINVAPTLETERKMQGNHTTAKTATICSRQKASCRQAAALALLKLANVFSSEATGSMEDTEKGRNCDHCAWHTSCQDLMKNRWATTPCTIAPRQTPHVKFSCKAAKLNWHETS